MQKATVSRAFAKRAPFLLLLSGTKEVNIKNEEKPKIFSQPSQKSKISQKFPLNLPEITLSGGALLLFLGYTIGVNNQLYPLAVLSKRSCINADDRKLMQKLKDLLQDGSLRKFAIRAKVMDGSVYLEEID